MLARSSKPSPAVLSFRLPPKWEDRKRASVKIIALTDIHAKFGCMDAIADDLRAADVVLLPGDLTMFGRREAAQEILDVVRRYNDTVYAVMGNCDFPEVQELMEEQGICLHRAHALVNGIAFVGLGGSLACPMPTLNEWTEEETAEHLEASRAGVPDGTPMVLVSHQPPKDTAVDLAGNGKHVGSASVRDFIAEHQPLVCFSGHIHESQGTDTIGNTTLINPGPFMEGKYAWAEIDGDTCTVEARQAPIQA